MSKHEYLFVTTKRDELATIARYVDGWWDHLTSLDVNDRVIDVWRSKRDMDNGAWTDAEIAVGRLASGLHVAHHHAADNTDGLRDFYNALYDDVLSMGSRRAHGWADIVVANLKLDDPGCPSCGATWNDDGGRFHRRGCTAFVGQDDPPDSAAFEYGHDPRVP